MSSKVFLMRKVLLKDFFFFFTRLLKQAGKCPVSCMFFGVVISPNSTVSRCCLVASVRPWKWTKAGNREVHISPLRWRLMLLSLLPVLRSQKVQRRSFSLLGASLPVQVYTRQRSLKKRPPLPSITQTVNLHHFYHILRIIIHFLKHNWHVFFLLGEELIEEIKLVRDQRKQLEWTRQELLRKGKDLLSQNRHRRNQGEQEILFSKKRTFYKDLLQVLKFASSLWTQEQSS